MDIIPVFCKLCFRASEMIFKALVVYPVVCSLLSVAARLPMIAAFALATSPKTAPDFQYNGIGHQNTNIRSDISQVIDEGPVPPNERVFVVNGWRWHTMSVLRDLSRFRAIVGSLQTKFKENHEKSLDGQIEEEELLALQMKQIAKVVSCFDFVCEFNWKALIRVETKIFFPWLRELLPKNVEYLLSDYGTEHEYIEKRFAVLQDRCEAYKTSLAKNGASGSSSNGNNDSEVGDDAEGKATRQAVVFLEHLAFLYQVDEMLVDMQQSALRIQALQQGVFVPFVAAYVKTRPQEVFNNKVVSNLGLLDSQIHLGSMCDAIQHDSVESKLFKLQIPKIARSVLPLWRKRLYWPRTKQCFTVDS